MGPRPSLLLVLVLCLGQTIHMEEGFLSKPFIRANPGPVILRGQPVAIVCRGPAGADTFRLVQEKRSVHWNQTGLVHVDSYSAEGTFLIEAVNGLTAGRYRCLYREGPSWSEPSDVLELKVADEDVSPPPSAPAFQNYTVGNYVRLGLAAVVLLILVAILAEAGHSWHRWPHGPEEGRQESERRRN